MAAMDSPNDKIIFSDSSSSVSELFNEVGTVNNFDANVPVPSSFNLQGNNGTADQQQQDQQQPHEGINDKYGDVPMDASASVEKLIQQSENANTQMHNHLFDAMFNSPPGAAAFTTPAPPPGVPPVVSATPKVALTMGNIADSTTFQPGDSGNPDPGHTVIYGSGGDTASGAQSLIGVRDPLQFSVAQIYGTATGNDIIYAEGEIDSIAGINPASIYTSGHNAQTVGAKQFLLNLSGSYASLDPIVFAGRAGRHDNSGRNARSGCTGWYFFMDDVEQLCQPANSVCNNL